MRLGTFSRFGALVTTAGIVAVAAGCAAATISPVSPLERAPYLTAVFGSQGTVNWSTDSSSGAGTVRWGPAPRCNAHTTVATKTKISVDGESEWQWQATLTPLTPGGTYCYRPLLGGSDVLGAPASPIFRAVAAPGNAAPFSFAVLGDWGQGTSDESNVLAQIGQSAARFVMTVGDNAYPSGSQDDYGDLEGGNVFAPEQLPLIGQRPVFAAQGDHGFSTNDPYLVNLPQEALAESSHGRYGQDDYCCISTMAGHAKFASAWYAFDWGNARFYVLDAAWTDTTHQQHGGSDVDYQGEFEAHWGGPVRGCAACGAELRWLESDLAAHRSTPVKLAFLHNPFHVDNNAEPSDPLISGAGGLEGLLARSGVAVAFSGHAHVYERNLPQVGNLVTYVTGGGGGTLQGIDTCSDFDAYAVGADSSCGAPAPDSPARGFHFLLVTVSGNQVTVTPTDEQGRPFDVQTYTARPGGNP